MRISRFFLRRIIPRDVRDGIIGDLNERLAADSAELGLAAARRRFRRTAASLIGRFLVERVRDRMRSIARIRMSLLDVRLGLRMLVRYPVLTVVGSVSLALAIALGASAFAFITLMLWPRLPLPDGGRIVAVALTDEATNQQESRVTADFLRWRASAKTLTDFAAGRGQARNLTMADGVIEPVSIAEVTASTFRMTRVAPLIGRVLNDDDARAAAPPVLVIGERLWRERFGADPAIVGKSLVVNQTPTAVVGVMPAAYKFPSIYEVWQPLKLDDVVAPRAGIGLRVWARLESGVGEAQSNAELAVLSAQAAADWPATHAHLKAGLYPVATSMIGNPVERAALAWLNYASCLVVLLISGNVALLMFARAATRESEIVVRTALGAGRGRIIGQFVTEALALNAIAAVTGLWLAQRTLAWGVTSFAMVANDGVPLPFWITPSLPALSILYGIGLAVLATAMTGILPALKMTRAVSARLREASAGGGGLNFGGVWTALIVSQIAVTVFAPSMVFAITRAANVDASQQFGVPAAQYLTARLSYGSGMGQARFDAAVRRVREDLAALPGVARVTLAGSLPLMWNQFARIEVDEGGAAPPDPDLGYAYPVSTAAVQADFFAAFEAPALAGRLFGPGDFVSPPRVVVVNRSFVDRVLGGRNAVGRRVRYSWAGIERQRPPGAAPEPWFEIVGVVRDLAMADATKDNEAGVYMPLNISAVNSTMIAARVSGDMTAAANALRAIAARADDTLRIAEVLSLDQRRANGTKTAVYAARLFGIVSLSALVLALSGIYAVMSFAVSRRTREIGIRMALGSSRPRVVMTILRRPLIQTAVGIVMGGALTFLWLNSLTFAAGHRLGTAGYIVVMFGVCLLACVMPARRASKIDPIAALRND